MALIRGTLCRYPVPTPSFNGLPFPFFFYLRAFALLFAIFFVETTKISFSTVACSRHAKLLSTSKKKGERNVWTWKGAERREERCKGDRFFFFFLPSSRTKIFHGSTPGCTRSNDRSRKKRSLNSSHSFASSIFIGWKFTAFSLL